jgi:hypothetical protein
MKKASTPLSPPCPVATLSVRRWTRRARTSLRRWNFTLNVCVRTEVRRPVKRILATVILVIMMTGHSFAQEKRGISPGGVDWCGNSWGLWREDAKLLLNFPSTPLTLTVNERNGDLLVTNVATRRIVSYRLGHVIERKDGKPELIRATELIKVDLGVNQFVINPEEVAQEAAFTRRKRARLAVVEVKFSDGIWQYFAWQLIED